MLVDKDGKEMKIEEEYVTFRGDKIILLHVTPPRDIGKSAKVYIDDKGFKHEVYAMDSLRYGCSICGHRQDSLNKCEYCGSIRVVDVAFSEQITGVKWEDNFI